MLPVLYNTFDMDCRERGSRARDMSPTQDTSRVGTARVKQVEEADTRIIVKEEEASTRIIVFINKSK